MASDIFSLGLVLFELLAWQLPWRGGTPYQVGSAQRMPCSAGPCILSSAVACPASAASLLMLLLLLPTQVRRWVLDGRRPEVPQREALPGPDTAQWQGLDAYSALMRCALWRPPRHAAGTGLCTRRHERVANQRIIRVSPPCTA